MQDYLYYKNALKEVSKPCAFLDMDILNQNINDIAEYSNYKNIRIASKSIRSVAVLKKILGSSPIFQGIMCYTADEALYLLDNDFDDLLIAYPVWNSFHLTEICKRVKNDHIITLMIDSVEHIDRLEKIAKQEKGMFLVCIDIDLSSDFFGLHFGVHRSPIKSTERFMAIVNRVIDSSYLHLDGVMGYEAQIAGVTDNDPNQHVKSRIVQLLKRLSSNTLIQRRQNIIQALKTKGVSLRFINGGGTGSLHQTTHEEHITEVTVGSGFYSPRLFDYYQAFHRAPAAGFALEITRIPVPNIYTCYGGGYIASGAAGEDKLPQVYLPKGAALINNEGAGEVQTPIHYKGNIQLQHGDPIIMRHSKSGELCEHFNCLHLIQDGKIIGKYSTYRGDNQCFL
ncbi:amino acid deaminase/aldolase [Virgibacillus oceani]|uniref:Amino acid aldolase n=1 Tax=Virgibacillus oceani TaxID=1479511 RepID=A0A917M2C4_9BACI|nr:amino acid deaminase/aldolase [Virgibacillus oceani]GGG74756.1 amino acid aldolase [Virgibacillus oceani]